MHDYYLSKRRLLTCLVVSGYTFPLDSFFHMLNKSYLAIFVRLVPVLSNLSHIFWTTEIESVDLNILNYIRAAISWLDYLAHQMVEEPAICKLLNYVLHTLFVSEHNLSVMLAHQST